LTAGKAVNFHYGASAIFPMRIQRLSEMIVVSHFTDLRKVIMPIRRFLIISPSDVEQNNLSMLLKTVWGPAECACAATLEEGSGCLGAWQPDLVLIALDLNATSEALFFEQLRTLHLDAKSLLVADVKPWLDWHWGPWADRVLLKGFSFGDMQKMVSRLLSPAHKWTGEAAEAKSIGLPSQEVQGRFRFEDLSDRQKGNLR
jgi:hypothetical protein